MGKTWRLAPSILRSRTRANKLYVASEKKTKAITSSLNNFHLYLLDQHHHSHIILNRFMYNLLRKCDPSWLQIWQKILNEVQKSAYVTTDILKTWLLHHFIPRKNQGKYFSTLYACRSFLSLLLCWNTGPGNSQWHNSVVFTLSHYLLATIG